MNPFITIKELKDKLLKKELSPQEVHSFYRQRIKKYNQQLNAILELFAPPSGEDKHEGLLAGIPGLRKDNICQKGTLTTAGSKVLASYQAPYSATVISRLEAQGAKIIARGNMDEFAMGGSGEFSCYGPTYNPWDLSRVPGGSSSGPAAAVAAGLIPFALGTETGGSVRQPAAFCNLVGLYPTYGLHSRYGIMAFSSSNDQVGPLTRTVYDNALISTALSGNDPHDSTSLAVGPKDYTKNLDGTLPEKLTIGIISDALDHEGIDPQISTSFNDAVSQLKKLGATIKTIKLPSLKYGIAIYFIISRAEAASNLSRYDGTLYGARTQKPADLIDMYLHTREEGFGMEVKRRILVGNYVLSAGHRDAYYYKAQQVRAMIRQEFDQAFKEVDLLISPTSPILPFKIGELINDPIALYLCDYFYLPNCMIGTPALSVPCGLSQEKLPMGIQFLGPRFSEELLYKVAYAYEQSTDHHLNVPTGYN